MKIKVQIGKLYLLEFLGAFNLTDSVWLLLLVSRGFSLLEAGIAEGVFHLVSFICEIPSGMLADLCGRKRTLVLSWVVAGVSAVLMLTSHTLGGICLSFALSALGYNLASGTREALTYDSLLEAGSAERYLHVSTCQSAIWSATGAMSRLLAGVALAFGYQICYLLRIFSTFLGAGVAASVSEAHPQGAQNVQARPTWRTLGTALWAQTCTAAAFLRSTPIAGAYMLSAGGLGGLVTLTFFFLQQHFITLGMGSGVVLGPLLFFVCLGSVCGARLALVLSRMRHRSAVLLCGLGAASGVLLCATPIALVSAAGGFLMLLCEESITSLTDTRLNDLFPSAQRATLVSVFTMCFSLVMILASPLLGLLCTTLGTGPAFALTACALCLCTLGGRFALWQLRRKH